MGAEVLCSVTIGRKRADGEALLETNAIIFRGPDLRIKIPWAAISRLEARDGKLSVTYGDGTATFHLGAAATRWADKIRNPKSLIDKLGVKPQHRVVVLGVKDIKFLSQLKERAASVTTRAGRDADVILLGAEKLHELMNLRALRDAIKRGGMIWTTTPKGKSGIKDTDVMNAGKAAGLVDVKVAAFSPTHSALKFVIPRARR